jgi:Flp pilus assembly protein TadD
MQLLAEAYEGAGRPADAASVLSELVASEPDQSRLRAWLAELYEQSGQWPRAIETWRDLAAGEGSQTRYRLRHATALVNGGQLEAGRQALLALTRDDPSNVSAWYLLSQVEARDGRADEAERAARQIIALDADDSRGVIALAEALAVRGDHAGIVSLLESRVQAPTPADLAGGAYPRMAGELAAARQAIGDSAGAVRVLEEARSHAPADPLLLFELGAAYERDNRSADAEQAFRQIIAREPANADALNYLGYMLADRGEKLDEAVDLIRRALLVDDDNPSYLDSLGWAYTQRGDLVLAVEPLERAASVLPRTSVIQEHLGELYLRLKRYRDAAAAFERALSGDRQGIDTATVARQLERARELAGGR